MKRFTFFKEDDGYWIRDEYSFKIIATGLKLGVAENLCVIMNELVNENKQLKNELSNKKHMINLWNSENTSLLEENRKLKNICNQLNDYTEELDGWGE